MNVPTQRLGYRSMRTRVQFGSTDAYGVLWHGNAPSLFEMARAELVREFELPAQKLFQEGLAVPMVDLSVEYKSPAYGDDELEIQSTLLRPELPLPYLLFEYRVFRCETGTEVLRGRTRQILMRKDGRTLIRVPEAVRTRLEKIWSYLAEQPCWNDAAASAAALLPQQWRAT